MTKVAMYTSSQLFCERSTGGVKRFLELYEGMKNKNIDVDLFCGDTQEVLAKNNVKAYSLKNANKSKNIFIHLHRHSLAFPKHSWEGQSILYAGRCYNTASTGSNRSRLLYLHRPRDHTFLKRNQIASAPTDR